MASLTRTDCNLEISAVDRYIAFGSDALISRDDIKLTGFNIDIAAFIIDLNSVVAGIQAQLYVYHSQAVIHMDRVHGGCHCEGSAGYDQIVVSRYTMCRTA